MNSSFPLAIIRKLVYAYITKGDRLPTLNSIIRNGHIQIKKEREEMKKLIIRTECSGSRQPDFGWLRSYPHCGSGDHGSNHCSRGAS